MKKDLNGYHHLLKLVKDRIKKAQVKAILSVNAELICMYWDIGKLIDGRQKKEGWGAAVIPRLSKGIQNAIPDVKGFSERNIKLMAQFYRAYPKDSIGQQPVAKLPWDIQKRI